MGSATACGGLPQATAGAAPNLSNGLNFRDNL